MSTTCTPLAFSGRHIDASWIQNAREYHAAGRSIIVNVGITEASLLNFVVPQVGEVIHAPARLRAWHSTLLQDGVVESADSLVVLRVREPRNIGSIIREPGWKLYSETLDQTSPFPRDTPLYISPQHELGTVSLDPFEFAGQSASGKKETLTLKVNLWYAPPSTDCFIHTLHPFLEVHTQVRGTGRMQKFRKQEEATLYEDVIMSPGWTHEPFFVVDVKRGLDYPWHRYFADTDCIWMAIELHRPKC